MTSANSIVEFEEEDDSVVPADKAERFNEAVLYSNDWTVETILSQLKQGNIDLKPRFQRRDAWSPRLRSGFIESVILGLPIPQIILAEQRGRRGRYIVLDGKQRLLTLQNYVGIDEDIKPFKLGNLDVLSELSGRTFRSLSKNPDYVDELNAFWNQPIRTVVIRNWPNSEFLYTVFLRLNTGSVKLSPQELRQAMYPGEFSNFVDKAAADSVTIQSLLSRRTPDPRMRDVELLVRHLAFRNFLPMYKGRMKPFLDETCETLDEDWNKRKGRLRAQVRSFEAAIKCLREILGPKMVARKPDSASFNRAIFDALAYYAWRKSVRVAMFENQQKVKQAYERLFNNEEFLEAIESDTAGTPHTVDRIRIWGQALHEELGIELKIPRLVGEDPNRHIVLA